MKQWVLSIAIIAVAVSVTVVAALGMSNVIHDQTSPEPTEYGITYSLDGGALPEGSMDSYTSGSYTELPRPEKEGMRFAGWFTDSSLSTPIGGIKDDVVGDLNLYAKWIEPVVGLVQKLNISASTYSSGNMTVGGTYTYTNVVAAGGSMYVTLDRHVEVYAYGEFGYLDDSNGFWIDEAKSPFRYTGNAVVKSDRLGDGMREYTCAVWKAEGETRYVYDDAYTLRYETSIQGIPVTLVMESCHTVTPDTSCTPDVLAEGSLQVTGVSDGNIGDSMEFTATGDDFGGWYVDGVLATKDNTLKVDRLTPGTVYEARVAYWSLLASDNTLVLADHGFGPDAVVVFLGKPLEGNPADGVVMFHVPGLYRIIEEAGAVDRVLTVLYDQTRTFAYSWEFDGVNYTHVTGPMRLSEIYHLCIDDTSRVDYDDPVAMQDYYTVNDPHVVALAEMLASHRGNMDDRTFASFVLRFVQSITYSLDENFSPQPDYIKYPVEYMWDLAGDCEDSSIMYATLMRILGFDSGIAVFDDHAMGLVRLPVKDGDFTLEKNGVVYVVTETTSAIVTDDDPEGVRVGDNPGDYNEKRLDIIHIVEATHNAQ